MRMFPNTSTTLRALALAGIILGTFPLGDAIAAGPGSGGAGGGPSGGGPYPSPGTCAIEGFDSDKGGQVILPLLAGYSYEPPPSASGMDEVYVEYVPPSGPVITTAYQGFIYVNVYKTGGSPQLLVNYPAASPYYGWHCSAATAAHNYINQLKGLFPDCPDEASAKIPLC